MSFGSNGAFGQLLKHRDYTHHWVAMRNRPLQMLVVAMAIVAALLIGAALSLHQMYPITITNNAKSEEQRSWLEQERERRRRELVGEKIGILAVAGIDVAGIILVVAFDKRQQRVRLRIT